MNMTRSAYPMPPSDIDHPTVWRGDQIEARDDLVMQMSGAMIADIKSALAIVKARGLEATRFTREEFPLPNSAGQIRAILAAIEGGRGFALVRGFPMDGISDEDADLIFWGLGTHLGTAVSQNSYGHILGHVRNLDLNINQTNVRGYQTTVELAYHNDQSDVIALMCVRPAKSGGQSSLVSVGAVYNEMRRQRPDLVAELFQPFYIDRRGEQGREDEGDEPYYAMPVLSYHKGLLNARYIRGYIMSAQRFPEVPRLTEKQLAALDLFDKISGSPGMALDFYMQPGDLQLANNYAVFHSRTSFEDFPEAAKRRNLVRLWLCIPNSRELPPCFEKRFGSCEPGAVRGWIPARRRAEDAPHEEFHLERL